MAPSSKQVRTLVSPAGSVVAERVPKGTQQPFKAEMSGSNPVGAAYIALSTNWIRLPHSHCGDTGSSPVGVIRWLLRSSVIITGGSSTGELLIKTNPARDFNSNLKNCYPKAEAARDFNSNFKNCYPKAEVIGSNPIHRAVGHIQQYQPMAP